MGKAKHLLRILGAASIAIAVIRVLVLFSESYSIVASERASDQSLINLCRNEELAASASSKFRGACMSARADAASPVLLKALLRSVHTAFTDFAEAFSSPFKICILVLFILSGLSAPLIKAVSKTFLAGLSSSKTHESDSEDDEAPPMLVLQNHLHSRRWLRKRAVVVPRIEEVDREGETQISVL